VVSPNLSCLKTLKQDKRKDDFYETRRIDRIA
jgi:hypothetical protein